MKFMQIEPQPARGKLIESMWEDPAYVAEEKYDGDRRIAQFCEKVVRFTGRRIGVDGLFVEKTQNVPHLSASAFRNGVGSPAALRSIFLGARGEMAVHVPPPKLDGTVLDGEMVVAPGYMDEFARGGASKHVTSIMGSLPEEAMRKQIERGWLHYVVFDCLFLRGKDLRGQPYLVRRGAAAEAVDEWANPYASLAKFETRRKRAFYDQIIKRGGEGVILKHLDQRYGDKNGWAKAKKIATYDVVIIGFKAAKAETKKKNGEVSASRIAGKVGSVEIGQHRPDGSPQMSGKPHMVLVPMGFARGFSDRLMEEFTRHPKKYLGKVITIEANDREPTGKFRHPRVTDPENPFRSDKTQRDCVYREGES